MPYHHPTHHVVRDPLPYRAEKGRVIGCNIYAANGKLIGYAGELACNYLVHAANQFDNMLATLRVVDYELSQMSGSSDLRKLVLATIAHAEGQPQ